MYYPDIKLSDEMSLTNETHAACSRLFIDYARHIDFGDYDRFVELFTDDAVLDLGFRIEGKDKIRHSMTRRSPILRSRHVLSNISIEEIDEHNAHGIAYLTLYRHVGDESLRPDPIETCKPAGVGHYSNEFRLTEDGWRIAACRLEFAFRNASEFPT